MIWAANWKVNLAPKEALSFIQNLSEKVDLKLQENIWFFPQNFSLGLLQNVFNHAPMKWGAQNFYSQKNGAFSGENSLDILKAMHCDLVLIGHSERRKYFNETNEDVAKKVAMAQEYGLQPVICIGENIQEREEEETTKVLKEQLEQGLDKIDAAKVFSIAYEPVWAIGSGQVASPEQAEEAHLFIRKYLAEKLGTSVATATPLLYGGSVKAENAGDLAKQQNIDGFLIGGASLNIDSFCQIIGQTK